MEAAVIIAVDIHEQKLIQAREIGATHTVNASYQDALEAVRTITEGQGVDFTIEAAGQRETMETAFKSVRDKGGLCILAGNLPSGQQVSIDPFDLIKGKRIIGTWGGETEPDRDIQLYVSMFLEKKLNLHLIPVSFFGLDQINLAVKSLQNGNIGRAIIEY